MKMKTTRLIQIAAAVFSLASFATVGCAEKNKTSADNAAVTAKTETATPAAGAEHAAALEATSSTDQFAPDASVRWADLHDITYDLRAQFFGGAQRLEAKVNGQIAELTARRKAMNSTVDTKDWDFAMKEMNDSRTYLHAMISEAHNANPETWDQAKDKVVEAWTRTQNAYDKVKSSTTS